MRLLVLPLLVPLLACGRGDAVMPDFALVDTNPASASAGADVSPRDFLGKVSAWYFGHST